MSALAIIDIALALVVIAVAAFTIFAREAFAAVVGYVAYGLLASVIWLRLQAIDVAMTEAAIGGGVAGVLLIGAAGRLRSLDALTAREPSLTLRLGAAALCALATIGLAAVVLTLPQPGPSLAQLAKANLAATGVDNPITAVLIVFRSFDTLLEKIVLLLAVIGVWALAPDGAWGGAPGTPRAPWPAGPLVFLAKALPPVGLVVGVHLVWVGADHPGGAFQGGAILAAMWMIVMIAGLAQAPPIASARLRLALIAGPAAFLAAGLLGALVAGAVFAVPESFAKPLILFIEAFMTLSIAATLPMLVAGPPTRSSSPMRPAP